MVALVDCNSFFCSCEKVFRPDLNEQPVIVLSNNDGCAIARTNEAKALGIKMGDPYFKIKNIIKKHNVEVFSSNFTLYADMSQRVMTCLQDFTPDMEVYSIDEAFLSLDGFTHLNLVDYGRTIKNTVNQYTGIPVSVGIAPTKVLAKAANYLAKKHPHLKGVFEFNDLNKLEKPLKMIPVGEIWGVGRKSNKRLQQMGIKTALDLKNSDPKFIRKHMHLPGERLVRELNGEACIDLELDDVTKKQILSSRSFGRPVKSFDELRQAVSMHATRVSEKLRRQKSVCKKITVFVHTNPHKNEPQYYNSHAINVLTPTDSTQDLIKSSVQGLRSVYKRGYNFKKCGVFVSELTDKKEQQLSLFDTPANLDQQDDLMLAIDKINTLNGRDTVHFASCGIEKKWKMRSEMRSPAYTTRWHELPQVG